jgi:hypothetical protein
MKTLLGLCVLVALALTPCFAQQGNGAPSGPHFNLNIIGVENPKTATLTDSQRHSIFVDLGKPNSGAVHSNIYLQEGDFQVCDGNSFDTAYDCAGNTLAAKGAVFQLPANPYACPEDDPECLNTDPEFQEYVVYARALGSSKGTPSALMTTCYLDDLGETVCSLESTMDVLTRTKGRKQFQDVTKELTTVLVCTEWDTLDPTVCLDYDRQGLFDNDLYLYFWDYANKGLRLAQLRFYEIGDIKNLK